ncbi:Hypothetical predicted protein [Paramuricea clavata]|uniref:Uncharacterized protein n=1 Tax=Paramuricea clavata TaxID=317549 RepID=A0A6S7FN80_PARCT|nr:Hypothetical predicted protein [Paramuricea clavata]
MLLALQRYELRIVYKPRKELFIADALSRNYLEEMKETLVQELEVNKVHLAAHLPISPEKYQEFQKAIADVVMQAVQDAVLEGWPKNKANAQAGIKPYWTCKDARHHTRIKSRDREMQTTCKRPPVLAGNYKPNRG